ncbi:MAG: hypothetical protein JSW28_09965 [Thermoplasmata archaeon]|nr:MAG: hypothetical protein JSW28_09965 [Thermoplasmata archaeon]
MRRKNQWGTVAIGLALAAYTLVCMGDVIAFDASAATENASENNTMQPIVFVYESQDNDTYYIGFTPSESQSENATQTFVVEIPGSQNNDPQDNLLTLALLALMVIVFSLLLVHMLLHHFHVDGRDDDKAKSLLEAQPNPIEAGHFNEDDNMPQPEEDLFPLPLALTVLNGFFQGSQKGADVPTPSMGNPFFREEEPWVISGGEEPIEDVPSGVRI